MNDILNIICFLWYGDRWDGKDMGVHYVNTLYAMVKRNLSQPFQFTCFSTENSLQLHKGIRLGTFTSPSWKGCLPRLKMFDPTMGLQGQVLALDLDLIITGSLDDIASYRGDFCVRSKFQPGQEYKADGDIIGFKAGTRNRIWFEFEKDVKAAETVTGGRERYWYRNVDECRDRWQNLYPEQIVSYKRHVKGKGLPSNARIVSCHGRPRPHQITEAWAKEHWKL